MREDGGSNGERPPSLVRDGGREQDDVAVLDEVVDEQIGLGARQVLIEREQDRGRADAGVCHDRQRVRRVGITHRERAQDVVVRLE